MQKLFSVEQQCVCRKGDRFFECSNGWHNYCYADDFGTAVGRQMDVAAVYISAVRIVDNRTGLVVSGGCLSFDNNGPMIRSC